MPKDIIDLEDRNRTRLERGLIADITMPDLETRIAILRYKAEKFAVRLSDEVATYIARISKRSIRELEGNLKKVKMFSELQACKLTTTLLNAFFLATRHKVPSGLKRSLDALPIIIKSKFRILNRRHELNRSLFHDKSRCI
jgi:chromosomal replication initiation ATPase DnaA